MKARRSFSVLGLHAIVLGYTMPEDENSYLNKLTVSKDRREAYKDYLETSLNKMKSFSPEEMERKFKLRLEKRLIKANKR